jgi:hypothetical protein
VADQRAHVSTFPRQWVAIPVFAELVAVLLNLFEEECMEQPDVVGVTAVEGV